MIVLVTRPAAQAQEWVAQLQAAGLQAQALPLIDIAPPADSAAVAAAWALLPTKALVVLVSPNAATHFFALKPVGASWPPHVWAASLGPGTTQVLRTQGVPQILEPAAEAVQFDSESLWHQLQHRDWAHQNVLMVRGESGRDWLAERLREHGAQVDFVAAYRRAMPLLLAEQELLLKLALAQTGRYLWFFSSSEAIDNLRALAPGADWSTAQAVATHPRIADSARAMGLRRVVQARPLLADVVACIQSFAS